MRRLGAVLAGGGSRRFGSDKAAALWNGRSLIDHVTDRLGAQVDHLVLIGREGGIPDRPAPDLGPLGGLCAALAYAAAHGFDDVLTAACDVPTLPDDLASLLAPGPACLDGQPLIGLWPATLAPELDAYLASTPDLSMRAWIRRCGARLVSGPELPNINTPDDLAALQ